MTEAAKAAKAAYKKEWAKRNQDKVRAARERYWERVAERIREGESIGDIVQGASERENSKRAV